MMKKFVFLAAMLMAVQGAFAHDADTTIWRRLNIDSVVLVTSTRASATTPMAYTNVNKAQIDAQNYGQDVPFLLQFTPSVVVTSDAGAGVGYTGIRIRSTDATRINVTLDGIPMNDAESHGLFWVNTPDIVSSVSSIQVQRGVGTSTNGAGAFGGSVNMVSEPAPQKAYGEFSGSYGSFNTHKQTLRVGTGLLGGRWTVDARLSNIHSDGYVDRATTDLKSYMARVGYQGDKTLLSFTVSGGKERTYLAWDGLTAADMKEYGRRHNWLGYMPDGKFYKDNTDNYALTNYQLHLFQNLGGAWTLNAALHYYKGDGFYEEFKGGAKLAEYAMQPFEIEGEEVKKINLVRRKMMDNWFGGGVFSLNYKKERIDVSLGGAVNRYDGDHYGRVMWAENYIGTLSPEHRYYEGNGTKDDANVYLKASWEAARGLFLYGDLQYRHIGYRITGTNDTFNEAGVQSVLDVDEKFDFFNPKGGVFYRINDRWNAYASVAVAHREPTRNNYTEAPRVTDGVVIAPRAERLTDYEVGVNYSGGALTAGVNFYYMKYKDQFVQNGETNEIGEPLVENVPDSYRAGVELTAGVRIAPWLRWDVNATLSRNRINDYTDYVGGKELKSTEISYSPSVLAGSVITAKFGKFNAALLTNYVGKQFVTNFEQDALSLDAYCVSNLCADYTVATRGMRSVTFGVQVNNLFNAKYSSNGYGWDWMEGDSRVGEMYYFPQAGTNVLANITIRF